MNRPLGAHDGTQLAHVARLTTRGHPMRHAVDGAAMLEQQLEHSETRACIAGLVGRKATPATPAARRTVDGFWPRRALFGKA